MRHAFANLALDRPLAFIDLETTGLDPRNDRIVELAVARFGPGDALLRLHRIVDPGRPIPPAAAAIHGIGDDQVAGRPRFAEVALLLLHFLEGCDLAGFNVRRFDLPFLAAELGRCGLELPLAGRSVVDAQQLYHRQHPRDLASAVRRYLGRDHGEAHSAMGDALAAAEVLDAQVGAEPGLPPSASGLHAALVEVDVAGKFRREGGRVVLGFGKHDGRPLREVARDEPGYLEWMLRQPLLADARALVERALERARRNS